MPLKWAFSAIATMAVLVTTGLRRYRRGNAKRAFCGCPLTQFSKIQKNTHCPYARNARLAAVVQASGVENLYHLLKSCVIGMPSKLDGVVLELEQVCDTEEALLHETSAVLQAVCKLNVDRNPADAQYSDYHIDGNIVTQLRIAGVAWTAMCFGPCVRQDNPRYSFGVDRSFVLFISHVTLERHGLGGAAAWREGSVVEAVRKSYEENDRGYAELWKERGPLHRLGSYLPDWHWNRSPRDRAG